MNVLEFTALVWTGSVIAGLLGSLTGLGGGVVLVPLLTLFFKVDIRYAVGASLVSVIATSSGAAAAYVKEGFSTSGSECFSKSPPPSARCWEHSSPPEFQAAQSPRFSDSSCFTRLTSRDVLA